VHLVGFIILTNIVIKILYEIKTVSMHVHSAFQVNSISHTHTHFSGIYFYVFVSVCSFLSNCLLLSSKVVCGLTYVAADCWCQCCPPLFTAEKCSVI
jgi:hypothetical protein